MARLPFHSVMASLFRETVLGLFVRWASGKTWLQYPDERDPLKFCGTGFDSSSRKATAISITSLMRESLREDGRDWLIDSENPANWTTARKCLVTAIIWYAQVYCIRGEVWSLTTV